MKNTILILILSILAPTVRAMNQSVSMLSNRYEFKPIEHQDLPLLYKWFKEPHVTEWWPVPEAEEDFFKQFLPRIRSKDTHAFMVLLNGKPIGYIQYYKIDPVKDPWLPPLPKNTLGIDQFIGDPQYLGKGHGCGFIKAFINYLSTLFKNHPEKPTAIILDPQSHNTKAIKCYEKVGFKSIGIFKNPYNEDALVMKYDL